MGKKFDFDNNPVSEAFRAGNRARKKESVQDTVETVDTVQAQIDLFKKQTGKELEIRDGRPYFKGDLNLKGCIRLTSLPTGLKVGGNLWMEGCTRLTSLPTGLEVGGTLHLYGCTRLTSVPADLEVEGRLDLIGCTGLTSLPADLKVGEDLDLLDCAGLTSLPNGFKVRANLYLRGTGLTSLPFDLDVQGDWIVHNNVLTPFFRKLGIPVDEVGDTKAEYWREWQKSNGYLSEAFRAGNRARKKESAADTVESVGNTITFEELWDLFNTPEIQHSFETMLEDLIAKHDLSLETGRPDIHRQLGYRHLNLYRDNERICEFYWNNEHKGNNTRLTWLNMVPQDNTIAGCALCVIKNSADIKLYADAVIRLKQVLLGEHGDDFANEAFRAGNRARKKEAAQDTVQDTDLHTITFEELKDAFCVKHLRDCVIHSIKAVTDKHDLGIGFEAGVPREFGITRNGETVGWLRWQGSAGMLEWLTLIPVDDTIERCTLCQVQCRGPVKIYDSSIDKLRLVLLGLHGDSLDEAFRAGNQARKKEAVQDAVESVDDIRVQIELFRKQTGKELKIMDDRPYFDGNLNLDGCTGLTSLPASLKVRGDFDLSGCTGLTSLPAGLEVKEGLYLGDCTGLTSLPDGFKVGGDLNLDGCTGLTSLPAGLEVNGYLRLRGCTGLTSLPAGLTVEGWLNLEDCTGLKELPSDLVVQGWKIEHSGVLTPFFKKLGIPVDENGDTHALYWRRWQRAHGYLTEAFKAGNKARKKETVQDTVQDVEIDRMPDWSGTPLETFQDMHRILMDIDLSTKRISTDDSIYYQEFTEHGRKKPFESFSTAVFDAGCCIDFYLEDDVITMTALPIGRGGVRILFSPSPGYRQTHRPYIESNMGHPQWKVDPELWTELLRWIDKHESLSK